MSVYQLLKGVVYDMDRHQPPQEIGWMSVDISENGLKERLLEAFKQPRGSAESIVTFDPFVLKNGDGTGSKEGTMTLEMTVKDVDTEAELVRQSRLVGPHLPTGWKKSQVFDKIKNLLAPTVPVPGKPTGYSESKGMVSLNSFKASLELDCTPLDEDLVNAASPFKGHV